MMLRFQWDSLRRGDHILARDVHATDRRLRLVVVEPVELVDPTEHDLAFPYEVAA
jgi:hypothetical protein